MAKATTNSASSSSAPNPIPSTIEPRTSEATSVDLSADSEHVHHFPAALRRRRSLRPRRAAAAARIPPAHPQLNRLKEKSGVADEQQAVDPKVMKLRTTGPKLKTGHVIGPSDPDARRLRILADVCHERLQALGEVSSSSDES